MNIESLFKAFISLLICVTCSVTFAEWQPETLPHIHSDIFSSSNDGIPWSILEIVEDEQGLKSVWLEKTGNYAYVVYAEKAPFDGEREAVLFSDGYEVQPRDMVNIHALQSGNVLCFIS